MAVIGFLPEFTISVACLSAVTFGMEIGIMVIMGNLDKSRVGPQETPAAATVRVSMTSTSSEE